MVVNSLLSQLLFQPPRNRIDIRQLQPNRIDAAKQVALDFIDGRTTDRIGLVIFSGQSFTQCPMTTDYRVLKGLLRQVKPGMVEDGTAIGLAIAQGVNRLKDSKAKSNKDSVNTSRDFMRVISAIQAFLKYVL